MSDYSWTYSSGGTVTGGGNSSSNTITISWNTSGNQTIGVNYQNADGCQAASPTLNPITVNSLPVISINGPAESCLNDIKDYFTQTGMNSYDWSVTGGTINSGLGTDHITVKWTTTGAQKVQVNYILNGCTAIAPAEFPVNVLSLPDANAGGTYTIGYNTSTNLIGIASGGNPGYSLDWSPHSELLPPYNELNASTKLLTANQLYTFAVTDSKGCTAEDFAQVVVSGSPLSCTITPDVTSICAGCVAGNVTLTAEGSGGGGVYTYNWTSAPVGFSSTQQSISVCPADTTTYSCTISDGYTQHDCSAVVNIDPTPVVTSLLAVTICSGDALNYSPTSSVPGATYIWSTSPGSCTGNSDGQGNMIADVLSNSGNSTCQVSYTITPYGPSTNACAGNPVTLVVNVLPVASITNTSSSQSVISGHSTASVTFISNVAGSNIRWEFYSVDCPAYISPYLINGNNAVIPAQLLSIASGGPATGALMAGDRV
jgi:hypothetical protein